MEESTEVLFSSGKTLVASGQLDLFGDSDTPPSPVEQTASLFADVVFDRPLDQAFTYAVPDSLTELVAEGRRVLAPLGKGDRSTVGYCVRLSPTPPAASLTKGGQAGARRIFKSLLRV